MKKITSIILSALIMCTLAVPALALDTIATDDGIASEEYCRDVIMQTTNSTVALAESTDLLDLKNSFYLYNFSGNPIAIFYQLNPAGYAIYDFSGKTVLEYSTECDHPFYTDITQKYYYEGVLNYFIPTEGGFKNLATGEVKSVNAEYEFNSNDFYHNREGLVSESTRASEGPVYLENDTRLYDCNTADNLEYFYPDLSQEDIDDCPGICGSLASAILIAYYDDYHSDLGDFATDWKKTSGSGTKNAYGKPLVKELIEYIEPNANGSVFLNPGVSSYLRDRDITGRVSLGVLTVYQQTKNSIGSDGTGDPIIVGTTSHYSIGVGYKNITAKQIYTNTGYGYHSWINASTIISTWTMHID